MHMGKHAYGRHTGGKEIKYKQLHFSPISLQTIHATLHNPK